MTVVHKPAIVIEELGELGRLPDGGVINAGGVEGPYFTVNGQGVILADGTASDGSGPVIVVGSSVIGYEHEQTTPSVAWIVQHNKGSKRIQVTVWDDTDEMVYADVVKIIDENIIHILFNTAITGRAILMVF